MPNDDNNTPSQHIPLHPNPISDPLHPAHQAVSQHFGRAIGHLLTGDHETAKAHMHEAIENWFAPHAQARQPQQPTMMPSAAPKPDKKRKAKNNDA